MMGLDEIPIREVIKDKAGVELLRELLRLMPLVGVEDYYKNGVWLDSLMRLDIEILDCHRREAGAPDPIPLSEVQLPEMPIVAKLQLAKATLPGALRPSGPSLTSVGVLKVNASGAVGSSALPSSDRLSLDQVNVLSQLTKAAGFVPSVPSKAAAADSVQSKAASAVGAVQSKAAAVGASAAPQVKVVSPTPGLRPPLPTGETVNSVAGASADMRQVAMFVGKWRLEPTRTKLLLARLNPARRTYVMQNFIYVPVNGVASIDKLEEYVAECEQTNAWASSAAAPAVSVVAPPGPSVVMPPAADQGVKRPLEAAPIMEMPTPKRASSGGMVVIPPAQVSTQPSWVVGANGVGKV